MLYNCVINIQKIGYNIGINYTSPYYIERITYIMQKVDIKAIVKNLNKEELRDLISVAQGVLSALALMKSRIILRKVDFLRDMNVLNVNVRMLIKMERLEVDKDIFVKDVVVLLMSLLCLLSLALT